MKVNICMVLFLGVLFQAYSQDGLSRHLKGVEGCYLGYYSEFVNKGAQPVPDGDHEVVISIIYQNSSECYMGKAKTKDQKIVLPVTIQKDDKTFVPLRTLFKDMDKEWLILQDSNTLFDITDGMSKLFVSQQGYQVQVFFPEVINTNSGVSVKAPPASEMLKKGN
ncbi:hypothetical protein J0A68_19920 [Algoriphagus sp. H41]|uniref:NlpE N-terminal domain-containing protein n=1 Tax=Algoriphagus oliviformis TaxID=2811231 RepID=A0ABS3C7Z3_9BACT|nr:hypothetical protein [Algoriphagus oliviformis]MBN7813233.1 hypothetical protein [Algoriphagus oliviformis]